MVVEQLTWLTSSHVLQIAKLQQFGLLSKAAIFDTERRLARRLHKDTIRNLSEPELEQLQSKRSKQIYNIRKQLQQSTIHRINLKAVISLEIQSIKKMREHNRKLIKQVQQIAKTITDSHNLILYEQQQVTHDVATVITFLAHFVHILELNLDHNGLIEYIPIEYQQRLSQLVETAKVEMVNIEVAAEDALIQEFAIHKFMVRRGEQKIFRTQDLGSLIETRARANHRLHSRINGLKHIVKQVHNLLLEVKDLSTHDKKGTFLPEIAIIITHASAEFQIYTEHLSASVKVWPMSPEHKQNIINSSKLMKTQIKNIQTKLAASEKQRKVMLKKSHHLAVDIFNKPIHEKLNFAAKYIDEIINNLNINNPASSEQATTYHLINNFLRNHSEKIQNILVYLSQISMDHQLNQNEIYHKNKLFQKFTKSIETFETKMDICYKDMKARLQNTTDIIKNSLLLQQHLAIELDYLQKYLRELYANIYKTHLTISSQESSSYKSSNHGKFAKQMLAKESELKMELKKIKDNIGEKIAHLIKEIPDDEALEYVAAKADINIIKKDEATLSSEIHNLAHLLGSAPANAK